MIGINFTSAFKASSRRRDAKRTEEIPFSVSSGETSRMEGLECWMKKLFRISHEAQQIIIWLCEGAAAAFFIFAQRRAISF